MKSRKEIMKEYRKLITMPRSESFTAFEYTAVLNALQWVLWDGSGTAPSEWFRVKEQPKR